MNKTADVIVTDGFTGNVALKTLEGGMKTLFAALLDGVRQPSRSTRSTPTRCCRRCCRCTRR